MSQFDRWPGACKKLVNGPSGWGSAYEPIEHDWRLLSREKKYSHDIHHQPGAPGYGNINITQTGWVETWYCTRCRLVDERHISTKEEDHEGAQAAG